MSDQKIVIGERVLTREELFREEEEFRKERAGLSLEEKIRILVGLQKLAQSFGRERGVIVWRIEPDKSRSRRYGENRRMDDMFPAQAVKEIIGRSEEQGERNEGTHLNS